MPQDPDVSKRQEGEEAGWQRLTTESMRRIDELAQSRIGKTLAGRFKIERLLAIGGMATVYEAIQAPLMRRVAVKILHPTEIEAGRTEYFLREANAAAGLRHPNIISIVDFGKEDDGTLFLAMEYVPGLTFSELLAREYPLPEPRLIHIIEQVCLALEVAHHAGVIHCDMKPGNIMIESVPGNPDHVKVLDFGISRQLVKDPVENDQSDKEIIGSYYYMAPEQIQGKAVTPRTDVYGLGVVLYTALTASFPFDEKDDHALMEAIINKRPPNPSAARPELLIPPAFDAVIMKALAKNPEERYASCAEFRRALLSLKDNTRLLPVDAAPNSLDILLPDDDNALFEIEVETQSFEEDIIPDLTISTPEMASKPLTTGSLPELSQFSARALARVRAAQDEQDAPPAALSGRPPIIGRSRQLTSIQRAALMTRRGVVCVQISGNYGSGSSFFLGRAMEMLGTDLEAIVLMSDLNPEAREKPFWTLRNLICNGLDEHLPNDESQHAHKTLQQRRQEALGKLNMGRLETEALAALLRRWGNPIEPERDGTLSSIGTDWMPYGDGPLRFPETRIHVLVHAFAQMLRALAEQDNRSRRSPLVLAIDGWARCDTGSRRVLQQVLTLHRELPVLFAAVVNSGGDLEELPDVFHEAHLKPYSDGRPWDMDIQVPPYTFEEIQQYMTQHLGHVPPPDLARRVATASGGSPLFIKEMLHLHQNTGGVVSQIPESPSRFFTHQLDSLSRDGKMLLAVCTLLGATFPQSAVQSVMPAEFDVHGTLAELMGARVLEPVGDDLQRLRFRFPRMRAASLKRLHPSLRHGLHTRIVKLLRAGAIAIEQQEAELWMALHCLKSGSPLTAMDTLLVAAQRSLKRWEPELALRRCRQVLVWLAACAARHPRFNLPILGLSERAREAGLVIITDDLIERLPDRELESLLVRATQHMLTAARRLQIPPERGPTALIPERLPQRFLEQLRSMRNFSARDRGVAALETGRYFSRLELPQSARSALLLALQLARASKDASLPLLVEVEVVRNLHRLGRHGQATDLAHEVMERIRALKMAIRPPELSLSKLLDLLAKIYIGRRLYPRAEHYLDQARAIAEQERDHDQLCKIYLHYAALYRAQNQHQRTLQALNRAQEVTALSQDLRSQTRVLYNLGITSANLGQRAEGRRHLSDAIEVAINLGWTDFIALVNGQLKKL